MPNVSLGIDHPVVTVRNLAQARDAYRRLGFAPNPVGFHPWGTTLSLLMFEHNFIELISVHDPSKFGTNSVDGFCYGRNVGRFLERVEGLGLVALHSKDAIADHARLTARGLESQGLIDFRRQMTRPDGTPDVAIVSLGLFLNRTQRDVSNFICHQHRPELVWIPEWQRHPNGVTAVTAVTYLADNPTELLSRYVAIYGERAFVHHGDCLEVDSGYGVIRTLSPLRLADHFGEVALPDWNGDRQPHGIAITVCTRRFEELEALWEGEGVRFEKSPRGTLLIGANQCGNVIIEFEPERLVLALVA